MPETVHDTVADQLRRTRQRYTPGRQQLVELLLTCERPVTIPELVEGGARQSPSSLYRNLSILEQCGVLRRLTSVDEIVRYELAESLTEHHHHLVCDHCGRIEDVTLAPDTEQVLHEVADATGDAHGFTIAAHHLELVGTCPDCR